MATGPTGGQIGSTLGKYGLGLLGFGLGGLAGGFIGSRIGAPVGNLVGSGLSSLFGPRGIGLLASRLGKLPSPMASPMGTSAAATPTVGGNLAGYDTTGRNRYSLYSTSNQGPSAFARSNTANVLGRNII